MATLEKVAAVAMEEPQMAPLAAAMHEFGDVSSDLSIPKLYYWIPVLLGVVASAAATIVFIIRWRRRP